MATTESVDAVIFGIVGGLCQVIFPVEVFEVELDDAVLERGKRGPLPMAKSVSQKHEITYDAIGNHRSHHNTLESLIPYFIIPPETPPRGYTVSRSFGPIGSAGPLPHKCRTA